MWRDYPTHNLGIPGVLEGDLFRYSFRRMSAFSAPSWMIYFVGTKMLNTINLTCSFSNGCMAQWIMRCPYKSKDSGSTPARWDVLFSFFRSCFVSFLRKHIGSVCSLNLLGNKVTFDSKPKKVWTYFLLWDYYEYVSNLWYRLELYEDWYQGSAELRLELKSIGAI